MIEWKKLTSTEVPQVSKHLPVIIPIGLVEAHGPHLPLSVDMDTAEYFSRKVAENTGAILAPILNYGFADEMAEYPGTVGLRPSTLTRVVVDIVSMFVSHGFKNIIFLSGHGANKMPCEMAFYELWESFADLKIVYWNYWTEAGMTHIHHADKGETEIAMSVGTPAFMDRAKDYKVTKPWYRIRSRYALNPDSGGINGEPTKTVLAEGEAARDEIVSTLSKKVSAIISFEKDT